MENAGKVCSSYHKPYSYPFFQANMEATVAQPTESYTFNVHARAIKKIFNNETIDIYFIFPKEGNRKIGAHKTLLSAHTPVFDAMFNGGFEETNIHELPITDATFERFGQIILYIYSGKVTISGENVAEILNLANKYNLPEIMSSCSSFLTNHLDEENAIDCLDLARKFGFDELTTLSRELVGCYTLNVIETQSFLECNQDILHEILSIDPVSCDEESIFDACIKWAKLRCNQESIDAANPANLRSALGNCFQRIRFNEMDQEGLLERVNRYKDMFSKDEIIEMFQASIHPETVRRNIAYSLRLGPEVQLPPVERPVAALDSLKNSDNGFIYYVPS